MTNILPIVDKLELDIEPMVGAMAINLYTTFNGVSENYQGEVIAVQEDKITVKRNTTPEQITVYQQTNNRAPITPCNDNTFWETLSINGRGLGSSNGCLPIIKLYFKIDPLIKFLNNGITK
jgi:hypothetical protein